MRINDRHKEIYERGRGSLFRADSVMYILYKFLFKYFNIIIAHGKKKNCREARAECVN